MLLVLLVLPALLVLPMFMVVPRGVGDTRLETADHVKTSELLLKEECPGDDKEGVDMCLSSRGQHL